MKYRVYFEFFGKKMQTEVMAENEYKAKEQVKNKIIFHKVVEDNFPHHFFDILGIKL